MNESRDNRLEPGPLARIEADGQGRETATGFIVGIGASAGGLDALERLFRHCSPATGLSFVVIQHLSPEYESRMDELLARQTEMKISVIHDGMEVEPDHIYLNTPSKNVSLKNGCFRLVDPDADARPNLPIDAFFHSLAEHQGGRAIAVVLSGTGSDGSQGAKKVAQASGLVVVQDVNSASFDGMPRAAIATGIVDVIARPESIPEWILRYTLNPNSFPRGEAEQASDMMSVIAQDPETAMIFRTFRQQYGIDFSYYRASTISRRLERRIQMSGCENLTQYMDHLLQDSREMDTLYRDLLVEVTQFFRDPEGFEKLSDVIPPMLESAGPRGQVRIWVPGCATGEEAYSLAMLFDSVARQIDNETDIKVFATDVHPTSLEIAGSGVYSRNSIKSVPEELREAYFQRVGELYHVKRELRQLVVFAPHDITKDPPFTRIDLISCRNVLIYLEPVVQQKVLSLFHFGMKVGGILYLGPSETVGPLEPEFDLLDRHWKIFRKLRNVRLSQSSTSLNSPIKRAIASRPSFVSTATRLDRNWVIPEAHERLLQQFVPPSVLVNEHREVVHSFGDAHRFLVQPGGPMTLDVTKLLPRTMGTALVSGLAKVNSVKQPVTIKRVLSDTPDGPKYYDLIISRLPKTPEKLYLVTFQDRDEVPTSLPESSDEEDFDATNVTADRIRTLERELAYTRETLQATVEELETSNEELQSTNEELVASNEELQSTNEELHSVNEELHTVNSEHQSKIIELTHLTRDMDNLLRCSQIGTLFLDDQFRIRRFTPAAQQLFHVLEQDIGRPMNHIAHRLGDLNLIEMANAVMTDQRTLEKFADVGKSGRYLIRCSPYQEEYQLTGVVVTFVCLNEEDS